MLRASLSRGPAATGVGEMGQKGGRSEPGRGPYLFRQRKLNRKTGPSSDQRRGRGGRRVRHTPRKKAAKGPAHLAGGIAAPPG